MGLSVKAGESGTIFNQLLYRIRNELKISVRDASAAFGVGPTYLNKIENGTVKLPGLEFKDAAKVFFNSKDPDNAWGDLLEHVYNIVFNDTLQNGRLVWFDKTIFDLIGKFDRVTIAVNDWTDSTFLQLLQGLARPNQPNTRIIIDTKKPDILNHFKSLNDERFFLPSLNSFSGLEFQEIFEAGLPLLFGRSLEMVMFGSLLAIINFTTTPFYVTNSNDVTQLEQQYKFAMNFARNTSKRG